jgi:hypothetical protein
LSSWVGGCRLSADDRLPVGGGASVLPLCCYVRHDRDRSHVMLTDQLPRQPLPQVAVVNRVAISRRALHSAVPHRRCGATFDGRSAPRQLRNVVHVDDDRLRDLAKAAVVAGGIATDQRECLVHAHPADLGDHALGLLDDHPAVERTLQLFAEHLPMSDGAFPAAGRWTPCPPRPG